MLSSFSVSCPQEHCSWSGSLVPSVIRGGSDAEITATQRAWFRCPRCQSDWEVRITQDRVVTMRALERGG